MSENANNQSSNEDARPESQPADAPTTEAGAAGAPDPKGAEIQALKDEIAGLKDQLLRALAETENVRRRADRDKQDAQRFAASNFAKDLLSVADNFHRALESATDSLLAAHPEIQPVVEGVRMTQKEMLHVFERHGIERIEAMGHKLDPNRHQAVFEVPDDSHPPGTVVQELQAGYMLHERLLRPAMVGVAKPAG